MQAWCQPRPLFFTVLPPVRPPEVVADCYSGAFRRSPRGQPGAGPGLDFAIGGPRVRVDSTVRSDHGVFVFSRPPVPSRRPEATWHHLT
jgi:hypothetical protein